MISDSFCFGVDLGGTTVKIGLFKNDKSGTLLEKWEIPTRKENGGDNILPDIARSILAKMDEKGINRENVEGVGIGVPGPVDEDGVVHGAVNIGWGTKDISKELGALLGLPVKAANDANAAALGEMWAGGGAGYKNIVLVTLGTGVGGGVIINGRIVAGSTGAAGELGHIPVEENEPDECGCGKHGCLEQYASATGISRLARRRLAASSEESMLRECGEAPGAKDVFDAVKAGDKLACEVAEDFGRYLGKGLAAAAAVVNPEVFVIGGGVSKAGNIVCEYVRKYYEKYVYYACKNAEFKIALLANDAGIYGAVKLILE